MAKAIALHEGVIRPGLVAELESFRAPDRRVSSYYLNLKPPPGGDGEAARLALKPALAQERERIDRLDVRPAVRHALRRNAEIAVGERLTLGLAVFAASDSGYGRAVRLPRPVRPRAFFEDRFVLWPLRQILDQADRYGIILTDKEHAGLFLYFLGRIEEATSIQDEVPGRVRFPDPFGESHSMHRRVEHFHHHFERVAEAALRLYERESFEHLIIGGRWETLPQSESRGALPPLSSGRDAHQFLWDAIGHAVWQMQKRLAGLLDEQAMARFAMAEEFNDQAVRRQGVEDEWERFTAAYRDELWPERFAQAKGEAALYRQWTDAVRQVEQTLATLQPLGGGG